MTSRFSAIPVLALSATILLAGCKKETVVTDPGTTGAAESVQTSTVVSETTATASVPGASASVPGAPAPMPAAAPMSTQAVIASAEYSRDPELRADLLEVKRVSGGALLVKWRVVNTSNSQPSTGLTATATKPPINYDFSWTDLYYVDPAENKKYEFLKDSEGNRIIDVWYGDLKAGEQRGSWAKFPAPPPTSTKISLTLPKFPPFEDVPISQ